MPMEASETSLKKLEEELDHLLTAGFTLKTERLPQLEDYLVDIKDYWPEGQEQKDADTEEEEEPEETEIEEYLPDYILEAAEKILEEKEPTRMVLVYSNYTTPVSVYYNNIEIRKVPRFRLGYNVLGRAFPPSGLIEIAEDLYGQDFQEVKTHEMLHIKHPQKSEYEIRQLTRLSLPFPPRWH